MAQINQKWDDMLDWIFENFSRTFTVREISKEAKIPSSTVQRYIHALKKEGFLDKDNRIIISPYFKFRKTFFLIDKLLKSGFIEHLERMLSPSSIILFGSARKGEYEKNSDIDIFAETTKNTKIEIDKFEKLLNHKIHLVLEKDINNLPKHLFNNIINGIKLYGYVDLLRDKND